MRASNSRYLIECVHMTSRGPCWRSKQRNGGHVGGVKYSFGNWTLFLCKFLLLFHYANMASGHMSEHTLYARSVLWKTMTLDLKCYPQPAGSSSIFKTLVPVFNYTDLVVTVVLLSLLLWLLFFTRWLFRAPFTSYPKYLEINIDRRYRTMSVLSHKLMKQKPQILFDVFIYDYFSFKQTFLKFDDKGSILHGYHFLSLTST